MILYYITLYYTILYYIILYCIILYFIILYYSYIILYYSYIISYYIIVVLYYIIYYILNIKYHIYVSFPCYIPINGSPFFVRQLLHLVEWQRGHQAASPFHRLSRRICHPQRSGGAPLDANGQGNEGGELVTR